MRYEARGTVVYDNEDRVVVAHATTKDEAASAAAKANKQDQEWRSFDSLMRSNRSVCG